MKAGLFDVELLKSVKGFLTECGTLELWKVTISAIFFCFSLDSVINELNEVICHFLLCVCLWRVRWCLFCCLSFLTVAFSSCLLCRSFLIFVLFENSLQMSLYLSGLTWVNKWMQPIVLVLLHSLKDFLQLVQVISSLEVLV